MRAVIVCVDYCDYLAVCLPYNRHHFDEVMVITHPNDLGTLQVAATNECDTFVTDAFYDDGAKFNKYRALEEGIEVFGRRGLMSIMDADVLWPKVIADVYQIGQIYSPLRRMCDGVTQIPHEPYWPRFPHHSLHARMPSHMSGYTQIFNADDDVLQRTPWHRLDLPTAQGGDTYFQDRWRPSLRARPSWECLHLGPHRINWSGRVSPRVRFS